MTVGEIIKAVRWCIDEEAANVAGLANASAFDFDGGTHTDTGMMNRIIISKIGDALRWVCMYAPSELLTGTDMGGTDPGIVYEGSVQSNNPIDDASAGVVDGAPAGVSMSRFVLPTNFVKLLRVRGSTWHRAVSGRSLVAEDSEDYLKLHDPTSAFATHDRPQAALIEKARKELECWPSSPTFEFTCIVSPATIAMSPDSMSSSVAVPPLSKSGFVYYLAFLLLSAYNDARAARMLEIAKMSLGISGQ